MIPRMRIWLAFASLALSPLLSTREGWGFDCQRWTGRAGHGHDSDAGRVAGGRDDDALPEPLEWFQGSARRW
jgi:hypothetical protein